MPSVFISHNWKDKKAARKLADALAAAGVDVWLDEVKIKIGDSLIEKIRKGIDDVDYVVALISRASVDSQWVQKELDIAMNQEISGRRVKVLPVLVESCQLPSFLLGKLYGDISSPKLYRRTLSMLYDRLDAEPRDEVPDLIDILLPKRGASPRTISVLRERLSSDDVVERYQALRSLDDRVCRELLIYPSLLELVVSSTRADNPTHVRLEAIRVLGEAHDRNFAHIVERLANDEDPHVARRSIMALAKIDAHLSAAPILRIVQRRNDPDLWDACLEFFSKVYVPEDAIFVSLLSLLDDRLASSRDNRMFTLRAIRVLATQWHGVRDEALVRLLHYVDDGDAVTRISVLDAIRDEGGEVYAGPHVLRRFVAAVQSAMRSDEPEEQAIACTIGLITDGFERTQTWESIKGASDDVRFAIFDHLSGYGYDLQLVFSDRGDVAYLSMLLDSSSNPAFRSLILVSLAEIGSLEALKTIGERDFRPSESAVAYYIVRGIAGLEEWDASLERLLNSALALLDSARSSEWISAFSVLAQWRSSRLNVAGVLKTFPKRLAPSLIASKRDRNLMIEVLRNVAMHATTSQRRRVISLIEQVLGCDWTE